MGKRSRQRQEQRARREQAVPQFSAAALFQEARTLHGQGRFGEAEALYRRLLTQNPDHAEGHHLLGVMALQAGRAESAIELISRALSIDANNAPAHANLGSALMARRRLEEALAHYDRALQINPGFRAVHHNRGSALQMSGRHEEAARAFSELLDFMPNAEFALGNLRHASSQGCDWSQLDAQRRRLIESVRAGRRADRPFAFLSISDSAADQLQCARIYAAYSNPGNAPALWNGERYGHDRIRVAYISADFRDHIVTRLMTPIYENHDRKQFRIVGVALAGSDASAVMARAKGAVEDFIDVTEMSDAEAAARLRELEIDIAVDLTGYTQGGRPRIFARRPAPAQVSYLGFPGTMGTPHFDYILADEFVIPPQSQPLYAEHVVYLPHGYQANDCPQPATGSASPTRRQAGLPDDALVYCCFNNSYKLNPSMFDIWARLLNAKPDSALWLVAGDERTQARLREEAVRRGVGAERLIFAPRLPYAEHVARMSLGDLFLDTLPFNGGATVSDALCAGLPVLTCTGEAFAARMAGSLLRNVGLSELVANSLEGYEQLGLALAADPERLVQLRARLAAQRNNAPLFDVRRLCQDLESAYHRMWELTERGEPPASFRVEPSAAPISQHAPC